MKKDNNHPLISQEDIMKMLDSCYLKTVDGIPLVSQSVEELANEYIEKYPTKEKAIEAMLKNQILKCTISGFITGFGGFITMPVTIPANLSSVIYVQMRMIACCAYISGHELHSDQTQTFVYACLAGVSVNAILKQGGIKFGMKFAQGLVNKIPGKVLTKINQKVGFRFITKAGSKGIINLGKVIPAVGSVVGGILDFVETKIIADRAYKWFIEGDVSIKGDEEIMVLCQMLWCK